MRCACCNSKFYPAWDEERKEFTDLCNTCIGEVYAALEDTDPLREPTYPDALRFPHNPNGPDADEALDFN